MGVDVDVGHAQPPRTQVEDRQHGVVDVAEARGAVGHRVVQAAGEVERARDLAAGDQSRGEQ